MRNLLLFAMLALSLFHTHAFAESRSYSLCPNVQSYYYSDPSRNRSIVMNYDAAKKQFVFLRCGDSNSARLTARTKTLSCHIYRTGSESELCREEIKESRVSRVISDVIDAGVSTAVSGGLSTISKVRRVINSARKLSVTPQCLGTSMMKAMVQGVNSAAITDTFYKAATEIGPLTGLTRFATRNPKAKATYVFSQLDSILSPAPQKSSDGSSRRMSLSGPSYMTAQKSKNGVDGLVLDTAEQRSLCNYMKNLGNEPGAPAEDVGPSRAISSEPNGLIDLH
jgi:hypothetical protein